MSINSITNLPPHISFIFSIEIVLNIWGNENGNENNITASSSSEGLFKKKIIKNPKIFLFFYSF